MDSAVNNPRFERSVATVRRALALDLGCEEDAFSTHGLTVVEGPKGGMESRRAALAVTLGTGTVVAAEAAYVEWVRDHAPAKHFRAMQPFFLADLAAEMSREGRKATAHGMTLGFSSGEVPDEAGLPEGFAWAEFEPEWMAAEAKTGSGFDNALGEPTETVRFERARRAFVALDGDGRPAAVAGVWNEDHDRYEIGLDVRRDCRGRGLSRPVTVAATRWILDEGKAPIYTCGATNVRSQRVAVASGFRPLWTVASVWRAPDGSSAYS